MQPVRADNSAQILAVATRLFARRGFDGTSLQAIASEVGIKKPSLLYHYSSKESLRHAVLDNLFDHWRQTLPQVFEAVTSGHGRFDALTEELVRFFREDTDRARLVMRELLDRPDDMRRQIIDNLRPWVLLVSEYIRQGKKIGQIHEDVDAESYVLHVITLTVSAVANLPAISAALGSSAEEAEQRHLRELFRLARTGLFLRPSKVETKSAVRQRSGSQSEKAGYPQTEKA